MFNSKFTTLLLAIICILQTLLFFYLMKKPQTITDSNSIEKTNDLKLKQTTPGRAKDLADISEFDEIIQRPLFSNSRSPEEETVKEIVKQKTNIKPAKKPEFILMGVVMTDEEELALIKSRADPQIQRLRLDEVFKGWKLIEIDPGLVILSSGNQQITLEIERKANHGLILKQSNTAKQTINNDIGDEPAPPSEKANTVPENLDKKQDELLKEELKKLKELEELNP